MVDQVLLIVVSVSAFGTETYKRGPIARMRPLAFKSASLLRSVLLAPGNRTGGSTSAASEFWSEIFGTERF